MFFFKKPSDLESPWILSQYDTKPVDAISKDTTKSLKTHHILGIDFLYQNYSKQFKGAILNEEDGMNMQLQVAAFLNAMFNSADKKFLVLIISPDNLVVNWHYHLKVHGGLKVQIVSPNTCPEDFDQEHGLAVILSFSNVKLAEYLVDYDYFSVVVDKFDEIASKLVIKKLAGRFNIGLTERSFYLHPNQKLQWTMLDWSNPGCVGKLADFYEIDNDNFANFRDNYRHWWLRLTWKFCDSFEEPTYKEKQEYTRDFAKWACANHINNFHVAEKGRNVKKQRKVEMVENDSNKSNGDEQKTSNKIEASINDDYIEDNVKEIKNEISRMESSEETIIYDPTESSNLVTLSSMEEHPILNSIINNCPEVVATHQSPYDSTATKQELDQPPYSNTFEDGDVLMSIIDNTNSTPPPSLDYETLVSYKKEELLSQIFNDDPCTSQIVHTQDDNGFFESLIESGDSVKAKKRNGKKRSKNDDVDDILKETEILLRE